MEIFRVKVTQMINGSICRDEEYFETSDPAVEEWTGLVTRTGSDCLHGINPEEDGPGGFWREDEDFDHEDN